MRVVADHVSDHYKLKGLLLEVEDENGKIELKPPKIEGEESDSWMLVDLGDIIVQIFSREGRDNYRLEEHWADVQAARDAGLTYADYIDKKGAAAAAVASTLVRGGAAGSSAGARGGGGPGPASS